jgi:pilus assembly protein Flp/PilA
MTMFSRFLNDESGATAIEYGLIAAIISVGIITVLGKVQGSLQSTFSTISTELDGANAK